MITKAVKYWNELQPYRNERQRCKNYTYGDQWKEMVNVDGRRMTEEQYIREQGSAPLKNNLIRRIVRNVIGVFRNNYTLPQFKDIYRGEEEETEKERLASLYAQTTSDNNMSEIYCRVLEEYLIGGMAVLRKRIIGSEEKRVVTEIVRPESFFFNTDSVDPRGWDIDTIGEIHTLTEEEAADHGLEGCGKITEIWHLDDGRWRYEFTTDDGETIAAGASPFPSGGHPYVMKAYPFIDGEIHSFVADCIDQQRYINRLITLHDWIIRSSAKGVLLFPEGAIPDDLDLEEIAAQWSLHNGVIRYKAKTGMPEPRQVSTNSTNIGITELLNVQLKMMEDVSGINAALQGQITNGNISGTLYEQQTRHALTGLSDIIEGFRVFMTDSSKKDLDLLRLLL